MGYLKFLPWCEIRNVTDLIIKPAGVLSQELAQGLCSVLFCLPKHTVLYKLLTQVAEFYSASLQLDEQGKNRTLNIHYYISRTEYDAASAFFFYLWPWRTGASATSTCLLFYWSLQCVRCRVEASGCELTILFWLKFLHFYCFSSSIVIAFQVCSLYIL